MNKQIDSRMGDGMYSMGLNLLTDLLATLHSITHPRMSRSCTWHTVKVKQSCHLWFNYVLSQLLSCVIIQRVLIWFKIGQIVRTIENEPGACASLYFWHHLQFRQLNKITIGYLYNKCRNSETPKTRYFGMICFYTLHQNKKIQTQ